MEKFVYVGDRGEVVGTPHVFTSFGQEVTLDPADARALVIEKGLHLLPEAQFLALGENPDRHAAWSAYEAFRQSLVKSSPETPVKEEEEPAHV